MANKVLIDHLEAGRPLPKDLSHYFSDSTNNRKESQIKEFYKYFSIPGIGNLAGGLPNASYFPFDTLEAAVARPGRFCPTASGRGDEADWEQPVTGGYVQVTSESNGSRILVPKESEVDEVLRKIDLSSALQYGTAQGYPPLRQYLRHFTRQILHPNVPYAGGPDIIMSCGNTDGFSKAIELLSNEWSEGRNPTRDRQGMLVEEFCYMNAIQTAAPKGLNIIPVAMDREGMKPNGRGGLLDVLANWNLDTGKRPHLMYTVTVGQNPTGGVLSVNRRRELYAICQRFDVIIIEDDPYWFLQYPSAASTQATRRNCSVASSQGAQTDTSDSHRSTGYDFLDSLVPSYLSVDTDGRVVRLDTFSKTVAPGCRMGWITAQPALIERFLRITETSTQQPSGFVQSMVAELLMGKLGAGENRSVIESQENKPWNTDGWVRWLEGLRGEYEERMQVMCNILEDGRYMMAAAGRRSSEPDSWSIVDKVKMYDFEWPQGGMFVWLELNLSSHPLYDRMSAAKLSHALWVHLTTEPYLVLVAPGRIFASTEQTLQTKGPYYFRICFAAIDKDDVESLSSRFVEGMKVFWSKSELREIVLSESCNQM
ncbi:MAG: hypothetical protein M1825_001681 [Sarcosagium campestre]|nr:MAG: hypothetical protein M1825_001681 [Sarcosagium campestre]